MAGPTAPGAKPVKDTVVPPAPAPEAKPVAPAPEAKPAEPAGDASARPTGWQPKSFFVDLGLGYAKANFGNDRYDSHTGLQPLNLTLRFVPNLVLNTPVNKIYTGPQLHLDYGKVKTEIPAEFGPSDQSYANIFNIAAGWNVGGLHGSDNHAFEWRLAAGLGLSHLSAEGKNATDTSGYEGLRANNNIFPSDISATGVNLSAAAYIGYRYMNDKGWSLGLGVQGSADNTWASFKPNYDTTAASDAAQSLSVPRLAVAGVLSVGLDFDRLLSGGKTTATPAPEEKPAPLAPPVPVPPAPEGLTGDTKAVADNATAVSADVATSLSKKHGELIQTGAAQIDPAAKSKEAKQQAVDMAKNVVMQNYRDSKAEYDAAAKKYAEVQAAYAKLSPAEQAKVKASVEAAGQNLEKLKADVEANKTAATEAIRNLYKIGSLGTEGNELAKASAKEMGVSLTADKKATGKPATVDAKADGSCPEGYHATVKNGEKAVKCGKN